MIDADNKALDIWIKRNLINSGVKVDRVDLYNNLKNTIVFNQIKNEILMDELVLAFKKIWKALFS